MSTTTIQFKLPKTLTQGQVEEYLGTHWSDVIEAVHSDKNNKNLPVASMSDADSAGTSRMQLIMVVKNLAGVNQAYASIAYTLNSNTGDYDIDLLDLLDMEISSLGNYQIYSYTLNEDVGTLTKWFIYQDSSATDADLEAFNTIFETDDLITIIQESSDVEKFLNKIGLNYYDAKIKEYVDSKVDNSNEVFKITKDTTTYQEVLDAFDNKKGLLFCNNAVTSATSNPVIYALKQTDHILLYVHNHPQIIDVWKVNTNNIYEKTNEFVLAENQAIKNYVDTQVATKQDILVSGTNIKTINNQSLIGSGNIEIEGNVDATFIGYEPPEAGYSSAYYQSNLEGTQDKRIVVSLLDSNGTEEIGINIVDTNQGLNKSLRALSSDATATKTEVGDLTTLTTTDKTSAVAAINELKFDVDGLGEPFRVKQWASSTLNVTIVPCTSDTANTSLAKMTFTITGQEAIDYQVVGMIAYEVFDAASGGNRINCWPVCQFTGQGQTELSVRWMCGGTTNKVAKRINAWVLLKHR